MKGITYRKLETTDIDAFVRLRVQQLREEGAVESIYLLPMLYRYYEEHLEDGSFVSWVAVYKENIVGTSGMSFAHKPPYYNNPSGKIEIGRAHV